MARPLRFALCAALLIPFVAGAGDDVYRWVDAKGEEHYTDDVSTIPREFRKGAKKVEEPPVTTLPSDKSRAGGGYATGEGTSTFSTQEIPASADGGTPQRELSPEEHWRDEFSTARKKISSLERQIQADRELLDGGTLAPRINAAGGVAINPEAAATEQRLRENETALIQARQDLEDLERRAGWDAVPYEWRE